jgi:dihydroxy-acid dehydratase
MRSILLAQTACTTSTSTFWAIGSSTTLIDPGKQSSEDGKLRSNFAQGSAHWATRRAQWLALGISTEDMEKPKIAVVNSSSDLAICYSHLDAVARRVKDAIHAAGGIGFEIRTTAPSDFIHSAGAYGGYILSARDLIVNDIEAAVEGALLDGMVCLASCDKTAPAHLMAAGRLNIPTVVVGCGYQPCGSYRGGRCDIEDVFLAAGHSSQRRLTVSELTEMTDEAVRGPGVCTGMGTANSMHIACEALGMALPNSTPVQANSPKMWDFVDAAGKRIVEMVRGQIQPRTIMTEHAFANAVKVMLAVSASPNTVKHLQAAALESECQVDVYGLFERFADEVTPLAAIRPNGENSIEEFEAAGGTGAVMKRLEPFLHTGATTIAGKSVAEVLGEVALTDGEVIRPISHPVATHPTIVLVRGGLAPRGGIVKRGTDASGETMRFTGLANVYESTDAVVAGLARGDIKSGQVVVLRGLGPKGTPGMGVASRAVFALDGAGLTEKVAMVTDGQLSGLVNKGIVVGEVSPEGADGGPIALVENGDEITIDLERRSVDLDVGPEQLDMRRSLAYEAPAAVSGRWLGIYKSLVQPLQDGAVLGNIKHLRGVEGGTDAD